MTYYVYKITNTINNKIYIGLHKTNNINDGYFGSGSLLKKAIQKYGKINFQLEILYFCNNEQQMLDKERELIREYNSTDKTIGYNIMPGQGNYSLTEEGRKKISETNKGKKLSQSHIDKLKTPRTEQVKQNMKEAQKLRRLELPPLKWYHNPLTNESKQIPLNSPVPNSWIEGRGKINSPKTINISEKSRINRSNANKSIEKRNKISNTLKGHTTSQETKHKISKTLKTKHETGNI